MNRQVLWHSFLSSAYWWGGGEPCFFTELTFAVLVVKTASIVAWIKYQTLQYSSTKSHCILYCHTLTVNKIWVTSVKNILQFIHPSSPLFMGVCFQSVSWYKQDECLVHIHTILQNISRTNSQKWKWLGVRANEHVDYLWLWKNIDTIYHFNCLDVCFSGIMYIHIFVQPSPPLTSRTFLIF